MDNLGISSRIENMLPLLDERQRRLFLATEAKILGYGGISEIQRISGVSRVTITNGIKELENIRNKKDNIKRCRMEGGGRKKTEQKYPSIKDKLEQLLEVHTRGDPENPLKYTSKSIRNIETEFKKSGYDISDTTVAKLLKNNGYSLQSNKKELAQAKSHPDRNEQFEYINKKAKAFGKRGCPVLSIDAKKKENIGNYKNKGQEYHKKRKSDLVFDHDFTMSTG
ncbi:MAG: hypothetical protein Ta2F_16360 [Termitinemataceae bacterium]|nr:MAG: hypothetical protein Ta2F_16360 [Termitinemataceae bacterium]